MTTSEQLQRCIHAAKLAGCPQDQTERFITSGYIPFRWQWQFHAMARLADEADGPVDIGAGGARGPGKSHCVLSQVALDDCQRVEGLKCLFLRQTGTSAKESFDDLVDKVVRGHVQYTKTLNLLRFPNGSRILLGGFHDQRDIDKYIGIEYDVIIVEELNQLTEDKYQKLRGSLRTSKHDWRPRMYTSFNPGGIGHNFVKERYVIPFREKREKDTRFIPSTYKSNPALHTGYIEYLESLEGDLGKAWREGEWDLFAGQYFSEWRFEKHVVTPFTIPLSWFRFRSIDPSGRSGTTSCHWYAVDQNGTVFVYKEYYETGKDYDEHAKAIYKKSLDVDGVEEEYRYTVIDTAAFARAGYSETAVEIYERNGVTGLIEAAKERIIGWNAVHQYLRWDANTEPKLKIFSTCPALIKEIPLAQHDEDGKNPEDVKSQYIGATHNDACFTKDTLIKLPVGSILYQKSTGIQPVYEFMGSKVTANHPYLTQRGFIRLDELQYSDRIVICLNELLWTELSLHDIQTRKGLSIASIFFLVQRNIMAIKQNLYTDIYGKNIMVRYPMAIIFTIKIIIHLIIIYLISNVYRLYNIANCIIKKCYLKGVPIWRLPENMPQNGTVQKKASRIIVNSARVIGLIGNILYETVISVVRNTKHPSQQEANSATIIAMLPHLEEEEVFATLTTSGFFTANSVVVSNCDDLRYFLRTLRDLKAPKELSPVERKLRENMRSEQKFSYNYSR